MHIIKKIYTFLTKVSLIKTVVFNYKHFPFSQAILFPCLIYRHTILLQTKGKICFECKVKFGLMRIGQEYVGLIDPRYSRTIYQVSGSLIITGKVIIGRGSKICVGTGGVLTIGNNFSIKNNSTIICQKEITFGENCLLSWDVLIMDTDFHIIKDKNGIIVNKPLPIKIEDHVWIGCRNTILKGVTISKNSVIAANSTITKSFYDENIIIGGNGLQQCIIRKDISWVDEGFLCD